jgi:hypothetical protein
MREVNKWSHSVVDIMIVKFLFELLNGQLDSLDIVSEIRRLNETNPHPPSSESTIELLDAFLLVDKELRVI